MKLSKLCVIVAGLLVAMVAGASPVDVNKADAATLAANIKGVGMKKAEAIVAYRAQHGPFTSTQDLTKVKGIGGHIIEKNTGVIFIAEAKKTLH